MSSELSELKLQLEKVTYENKEGAITVDSLREANVELNNELEALKVRDSYTMVYTYDIIHNSNNFSRSLKYIYTHTYII